MNMEMKEKEKWRKNGWKELTISPGGTFGFFLVEACRLVLQILTLFQTKKCHYSHPFSDLTSKKYCHHYL